MSRCSPVGAVSFYMTEPPKIQVPGRQQTVRGFWGINLHVGELPEIVERDGVTYAFTAWDFIAESLKMTRGMCKCTMAWTRPSDIAVLNEAQLEALRRGELLPLPLRDAAVIGLAAQWDGQGHYSQWHREYYGAQEAARKSVDHVTAQEESRQ